MKQIKLVLIALILMISLSSVFAEDNSAAAYQLLGIDARSIGMGGTGTAFLDNVSSAYLNPAVLADVKTIEFTSGTRQNMAWDRNHNAVALGFVLPIGYVAASWQNATVSDIPGYDINGNPTGDFSNSDNTLALSYAAKISKLNLGITPKFYLSNQDNESDTGYGVDLGFLYHINRYFNVGMVVRDLIASYPGEEDDIPVEFIPGVAAYPIPGMIIAADLSGRDNFEESKLRLGVEYWLGVRDEAEIGSSLSGIRIRESATWSDILSKVQAGIRAGVNDGAFTAGAGLRFKMLEMNYAFQIAHDEYLNDTHSVSLLLRF